ncbi:meteorin-like protein [Odontesthes bonariensis]|uniref:meteorin-like protein n=1 Tax=Odontesthes bonariensis TaxID=219752 RepID=UPI003F5859F7
MLPNAIISMCVLALHCSADLCNWTGSGFAAGIDSRIVLQVRLRCTEGSVKWVYPGQALRVVVEPNVSSSRRSTICIKPSPSFGGASVFIERAGKLELLVTEDDRPEHQVFCFRADEPHRPAIYLQARPQSDGPWSRNTIGFRYEVLGNKSAAPNVGRGGLQTSCRPCNDTELLMAICNSDFVVRGHIKSVSHDSQRQTTLVAVSATRVYWQRSGLFEQQVDPSGSSRPSLSWLGYIHTLLRCHVKPGDGEFLFTGSEHFGDAWLGCAPRYKDFLFVYYKARTERRNSCDFPVD